MMPKFRFLKPHTQRVDEGFKEACLLAEVSLLPKKIRFSFDKHPVAMATGVIDRSKIGQPQKQVLVVVTSVWSVICFDHNAHHREIAISASNYTLR